MLYDITASNKWSWLRSHITDLHVRVAVDCKKSTVQRCSVLQLRKDHTNFGKNLSPSSNVQIQTRRQHGDIKKISF
jgi:hypothetical protein